MSELLPAKAYQEIAVQGLGTKYGLVAVFALFVYDWLTTIEDEVEYIWKRDYTAVTFLFFLNRYYAMVAMFVTIAMDILPVFTPEVCKRWINFQPFGYGIPLTVLPDTIIGLRVYALYGRNKLLGVSLLVYFIAELGVGFWVYLTPSVFSATIPGPENVVNSLALHMCSGLPSAKLSNIQVASFQFMQTVFDTVCLLLIVSKTIRESVGRNLRSVGGLQALIVKHGVVYYVVVFTTNLAWAMMILFATDNLKYAVAGVSLGLAPLSANRLTIFLRQYNAKPSLHNENTDDRRPHRRLSWVGTSTFEVGRGEDFDELDSHELTVQDYNVEQSRFTFRRKV